MNRRGFLRGISVMALAGVLKGRSSEASLEEMMEGANSVSIKVTGLIDPFHNQVLDNFYLQYANFPGQFVEMDDPLGASLTGITPEMRGIS